MLYRFLIYLMLSTVPSYAVQDNNLSPRQTVIPLKEFLLREPQYCHRLGLEIIDFGCKNPLLVSVGQCIMDQNALLDALCVHTAPVKIADHEMPEDYASAILEIAYLQMSMLERPKNDTYLQYYELHQDEIIEGKLKVLNDFMNAMISIIKHSTAYVCDTRMQEVIKLYNDLGKNISKMDTKNDYTAKREFLYTIMDCVAYSTHFAIENKILKDTH